MERKRRDVAAAVFVAETGNEGRNVEADDDDDDSWRQVPTTHLSGEAERCAERIIGK